MRGINQTPITNNDFIANLSGLTILALIINIITVIIKLIITIIPNVIDIVLERVLFLLDFELFILVCIMKRVFSTYGTTGCFLQPVFDTLKTELMFALEPSALVDVAHAYCAGSLLLTLLF